MLKFMKNKKGIMGLTLSNIGLIIATSILLTAVFSYIYLIGGDWQRQSELRAIAERITTMVEGMNTKFFENNTSIYLPKKDYQYTVQITSEYIHVSASGLWNDNLFYKKQFLTKPWPSNKSLIPCNTKNAKEFHNWIKTEFGSNILDGTESFPISDVCKDRIDENRTKLMLSLAIKPLQIDPLKKIIIEKLYVNYDTFTDSFILLYQ